MSKVIIDLNHKQLEGIVESLPIDDKLWLVRKLEKETMRQRWNELLKIIDERLKKHPLSAKEVNEEIAQARKEHYAKRCN